MRKRGSFRALVYRELLLCKKSLRTCLLTTVIFSAIPILMILSIRYGNLAMLPETFLGEIRSHNDLMLTLYAVISPCMLPLSLAECAFFDVQVKWDRFRRTTPVTPARMALAKYALFVGAVILSAAGAVLLMWLCHALLGTSMTMTDFAVIMALITVCGIFSMLGQVFVMLFRNVDRGMLAMMGCMAAAVLLMPKAWKENFSVEWLLEAARSLLPVTPVMIGLTLSVGFGLTVLLYKRREK